MTTKRFAVLMPVVLIAMLVGIIAYAVAQAPGGGFGGAGGAGGAGGRQPGGNRMFRGFGMMGGTALAVADGAVFVVQGNMLYKFDSETLELLAQAEIPRPQPPAVAAPATAAPQ